MQWNRCRCRRTNGKIKCTIIIHSYCSVCVQGIGWRPQTKENPHICTKNASEMIISPRRTRKAAKHRSLSEARIKNKSSWSIQTNSTIQSHSVSCLAPWRRARVCSVRLCNCGKWLFVCAAVCYVLWVQKVVAVYWAFTRLSWICTRGSHYTDTQHTTQTQAKLWASILQSHRVYSYINVLWLHARGTWAHDCDYLRLFSVDEMYRTCYSIVYTGSLCRLFRSRAGSVLSVRM